MYEDVDLFWEIHSEASVYLVREDDNTGVGTIMLTRQGLSVRVEKRGDIWRIKSKSGSLGAIPLVEEAFGLGILRREYINEI